MTTPVPHAAAFGMRATTCLGCGATFIPGPVHPGCEAAHCDGCRPAWAAQAEADYLASREQAEDGHRVLFGEDPPPETTETSWVPGGAYRPEIAPGLEAAKAALGER